jgi:hypothetical protein
MNDHVRRAYRGFAATPGCVKRPRVKFIRAIAYETETSTSATSSNGWWRRQYKRFWWKSTECLAAMSRTASSPAGNDGTASAFNGAP